MPSIMRIETCLYDYEFFRGMYLEQKYIDAMATRYVELCGEKCYVICIWPAAYRNTKVLEQVDKRVSQEEVLDKKDIAITYNGLRNLMIQAYAQHEWIGTVKDHFHGVDGKVTPCYDKCETVRTYIVKMHSPGGIIELKNQIRELFGIGNHSVHSSDCYEETVLLTHLLYNDNSIHLLNYGKIDYDYKFVTKAEQFKKEVTENKMDINRFIIESSSILGLYGIRKVGDLDYLTIEENVSLSTGEYDDHSNYSNYSNYYDTTPDELILNPGHHCYAYGMKFISLKMVRRFKENRRQAKDLEDVKLIDEKLRMSRSIGFIVACEIIKIKRNLRNTKTMIRNYLEDHHIYLFTRMWHLINGKGFK